MNLEADLGDLGFIRVDTREGKRRPGRVTEGARHAVTIFPANARSASHRPVSRPCHRRAGARFRKAAALACALSFRITG
ncbi:hypothetical protein NA655_07450 [Pseudomonas kuykendallii]|uniref:hypothetical protein n=1 Tax=Pseudomonas kuykendallii TaxID=1007099 RepID=UPI00111419A1|nr:hypothetical protein [Pseudomonas kuykendallii]MCQ4270850.1 hypothetical protein [Pseudomonas kuykendallii]